MCSRSGSGAAAQRMMRWMPAVSLQVIQADTMPSHGHRVTLNAVCLYVRGQFGQHRRPSGPRWKPGGHARSKPRFGQHRRPSGPRCQPRGHTRLVAMGWHQPASSRHHPGPQPSAALAAPAKPAMLIANAAPKISFFITYFLRFVRLKQPFLKGEGERHLASDRLNTT